VAIHIRLTISEIKTNVFVECFWFIGRPLLSCIILPQEPGGCAIARDSEQTQKEPAKKDQGGSAAEDKGEKIDLPEIGYFGRAN
jgi:hypothetical protein